MRVENEQAYIQDPLQAEAIAWESYADRHTLWMHDQGRISMRVADVISLSNTVSFIEGSELPDQHGNADELPQPETLHSQELRNWLAVSDVVEDVFYREPTSDPIRNKVIPWDERDGDEFTQRNIMKAVNVWNGTLDEGWDMQIRRSNSPLSLNEVITISRLEYVNSPFYSGPMPTYSSGSYMLVHYFISPDQTIASGQSVELDVKEQTWYRKSPHTTVKPLDSLHGRHEVTSEQLTSLLADVSQLHPRQGRVWPDLSSS